MVKMNIALDDIRSKAPKGATHYINDNGEIDYVKKYKNGYALYLKDYGFVHLVDELDEAIKPL